MEPLVNSESSNAVPTASRRVLKQARKARKENRITLDVDAMMRFNDPKAREEANKQRKREARARAEQRLAEETRQERQDRAEQKRLRLEKVKEIEARRRENRDLSIAEIKRRLQELEKNEV